MHRSEASLDNWSQQTQRKLRTALRLAKDRDIILTTHNEADCDGLAAIFTLAKLFESGGAKSLRLEVQTVLADAKAFVDRMNMQIEFGGITTHDNQILIVVDTNQLARIPPSFERRGIMFLIDHHRPSDNPIRAQLEICDAKAVATCAILANVIPPEDLTTEMAFALAVGIASDTSEQPGRRELARPLIEKLLDISGAMENEILLLGYPPHPEYEEVLEKEAGDAIIEKHSGYRIAVGITELDPTYLANRLRDQGVAVTAALKPQNGEGNKVSIRVDELARENGIYANVIARQASMSLGVPRKKWGGGHSDMGGAELPGNPQRVQNELIRVIRRVVIIASQPEREYI